MSLKSLFLIGIWLWFPLQLFPSPVPAEAITPEGTPAQENELGTKSVLERKNWNAAENWVWEKISAGEIADFGQRDCPLRPAVERDWTGDELRMERALRSAFLETVLLEKAFKHQIPHNGIHIIGALFIEDLDLKNAELIHEIQFEECRFEKQVDFTNLVTPYEISLKGSVFEGLLDLSGAKIGGDLVLEQGSFQKVAFRRGHLDGQLKMDRATFGNDLEMQGISVGSRLSARKSSFMGSARLQGSAINKEVTLEGATIVGELELQGAKVENRLFLVGSQISGAVLMRGARIETNLDFKMGNYKAVDLTTVKIGGHLSMDGATFSEKVSLYGLKVGDMLTMDGAKAQGPVHFQGSRVNSKVSLQNSTFADDVSFKGASIGGDLYLDESIFSKKVDMHRVIVEGTLIFKEGTFNDEVNIDLAKIDSVEYKGENQLKYLNLKGTSVNKVFVKVKEKNDWPHMMDLHGFTYNLFWGEYEGMEGERRDFFRAWLEKLKKYSPQPYEQCAKVLRKAGFPERANDVLYAGKEKERKDALINGNYGSWIWLTTLKFTIGYGLGLKYFRALWWGGVFLIIGSWVCFTAREKRGVQRLCDPVGQNEMVKSFTLWLVCFFYSFDMLLPIIRLRAKHDDLDLPCPQRLYFYFHQLAGWLLASFVVAGLAGITQT